MNPAAPSPSDSSIAQALETISRIVSAVHPRSENNDDARASLYNKGAAALSVLRTISAPAAAVGGVVLTPAEEDAVASASREQLLSERDEVLRDYVDDYEYLGEDADGRDGCYRPNERERILIEDAIRGWEALEVAMPTPAAPVGGFVVDLGERIRTQDNRITSHPVFVVEQKRQYVTDPDYNEGAREVWVGDEGEEVEPRSKGSRKFYVHDVWEFVTACFTEQGCKDYLAVNGHNLREPRIYVHSGYRNAEWIALREYFAASTTAQSSRDAEGYPVREGFDQVDAAKFDEFKAAQPSAKDGVRVELAYGELLACPFCGGRPALVRMEDEDGSFAVVSCQNCGCATRQHYFLGDDAERQVTSAWNARKATTAAGLVDGFRSLYRAYVRLLESGRDRIRDLGGDCDPVDVMERNDPFLVEARALLAAIGREVAK